MRRFGTRRAIHSKASLPGTGVRKTRRQETGHANTMKTHEDPSHPETDATPGQAQILLKTR